MKTDRSDFILEFESRINFKKLEDETNSNPNNDDWFIISSVLGLSSPIFTINDLSKNLKVTRQTMYNRLNRLKKKYSR